MNKLDLETKNIIDDNIEKIGSIFPNVIVESENGQSIDFDLLKQELSNVLIVGNKEKYQLTWPGKKEAIVNANTPTTNTLRPIKEKSVDFDNTENIYIEGDNLEVLKILQESYLNKIKCIYIDPPYNTGNDFIYNDKFTKTKISELEESGQIDEYGNRMISNSQSNGKYHSDWLSMMYPRLKLSRNLLTGDGVIFISIDDNEVDNLKKICDEIYGENNFIAQMVHQRAKGGGQAKYIVKGHDYILIYAKKLSQDITLKTDSKLLEKAMEINGKMVIKNDDFLRKVFGKYDKKLNDRRCFYEEIEEYKGIEKKKEIDEKISNGELFLEKNKFNMHTVCQYIPIDKAFSKLYSILTVMSEKGKIDLEKLDLLFFDYPKPTELIAKLIKSITFDDNDSYVLDFFSGSATTAHASMQLNAEDGGNRKYIMVQLPEKCDDKSEAYKSGYETICEIGQERIQRAGKKIKKETNADIDYGFRVYKVESSNMTDVYYQPNELKQAELRLFEENIKEDRTSEDLLTQVILDLGLTLDLKIENKIISNNNVYFVADNSLIACFDNNININMLDEVVKYNPLKVVFRDSSFASDNDRINVEEKFKKYSPETEVSII